MFSSSRNSMPLITRKNNTGFKITSGKVVSYIGQNGWRYWSLASVSITSNGIAKHQRNDFNSVLIED